MTIYDKEASVEKMYDEFGSILAYVENAVNDEQICEVEKGLLRRLHRLGLSMLKHFVELSGTGYHEDSRVCAADHQPLDYKGSPEVSYLSIFGEFKIKRASYASKSNEYFYPLDQQLNLPEQKYSYLLDKWLLSRSSENNYREAVRVFKAPCAFPTGHSPSGAHRPDASAPC